MLHSPGRAARATVAAASAAGGSGGWYIGDVRVEGATSGPLAGLTAVVKDSYDVTGHRTSNGSPEWRASHPAAECNAVAVQASGMGGRGQAGCRRAWQGEGSCA